MTLVKCNYCGKDIEISPYNNHKKHFCSNYHKSLFQRKLNNIQIKNENACLIIKDIEILIDIEDISKINKLKWNLKFDKTINSYYVRAWERNNYNNRKQILLHRYLMNTPQNMECDHINRNTLDNRKQNLRNILQIENLQNKSFYSNNKSGHKYISWHKHNKIWICEIKKNKKIIFRKSRKNLNELVKLRDEFLKEVI